MGKATGEISRACDAGRIWRHFVQVLALSILRKALPVLAAMASGVGFVAL